jgi:hypothetical protein
MEGCDQFHASSEYSGVKISPLFLDKGFEEIAEPERRSRGKDETGDHHPVHNQLLCWAGTALYLNIYTCYFQTLEIGFCCENS